MVTVSTVSARLNIIKGHGKASASGVQISGHEGHLVDLPGFDKVRKEVRADLLKHERPTPVAQVLGQPKKGCNCSGGRI
jgi:hypothetical protein